MKMLPTPLPASAFILLRFVINFAWTGSGAVAALSHYRLDRYHNADFRRCEARVCSSSGYCKLVFVILETPAGSDDLNAGHR